MKENDNVPLISIITVVYNAVNYLEDTIKSVIKQSYPEIEYIIIDGGSTDGTLDIIKKYEDFITVSISEPDKGIYDAMNKGVKIATGDWINFMNAGDVFDDKNTLESVFKTLAKNNLNDKAIIYGNVAIMYRFNTVVKRPKNLKELWKGMPFHHQTMFVTAKVAKKHPYDIRYWICADFNFVCEVKHSGHDFVYLNQIIAKANGESGLSRENIYTSIKQRSSISKKYHNKTKRFALKAFFYFNFTKLYVLTVRGIKTVLPDKVIDLFFRRGNNINKASESLE